MDLSEVFGRIAKLKDDHAGVQGKLTDIKKYVTTGGVPDAALMKMAKLGYVIDDWMKSNDLKDQRGAMLDLDGRIFWRSSLHDHEHDEQQSISGGVRS